MIRYLYILQNGHCIVYLTSITINSHRIFLVMRTFLSFFFCKYHWYRILSWYQVYNIVVQQLVFFKKSLLTSYRLCCSCFAFCFSCSFPLSHPPAPPFHPSVFSEGPWCRLLCWVEEIKEKKTPLLTFRISLVQIIT